MRSYQLSRKSENLHNLSCLHIKIKQTKLFQNCSVSFRTALGKSHEICHVREIFLVSKLLLQVDMRLFYLVQGIIRHTVTSRAKNLV